MSAWVLVVLAAAAPARDVERPLVASWGLVDAARGIAYVYTDPRRKRYLSAVRLRTGKLLWTVQIEQRPLALYRGRPVVWETTTPKYRVSQLDPATGKPIAHSEAFDVVGGWGYPRGSELSARFQGNLLRIDWRTTEDRSNEYRAVKPLVRSGVVRIDLETGKLTSKDPPAPKSVADLLPKGTSLTGPARSASYHYFGRAGDVVYCLAGADRVMMGELIRWDARTGRQLGRPIPLTEGLTWVSADRESILIRTLDWTKVISLRTGKTLGIVARPTKPWDRQDMVGQTLLYLTYHEMVRGKSGYSAQQCYFRAVDVATGKQRWSVTIREKD